MKCVLSFPVAELSGKAGGDFGIVMSNWRGLQVARRMVVPDNPQTTEQDLIRGMMSTASVAFQSVTANEKLAWEAWAEINKSRIKGQMVVRPAISEYCAVNIVRQMDGQATTDTAPTAKPDFAVTGITSFTNTGPGVSMDLVVTHNASVTANKFLLIKFTGALASAVVVPRASDYRTAEGVNGTLTLAPLGASPLTVVLTAPWAYVTTGDYCGVSVAPVSTEYVTGVPVSDVVQVA